MSRDFVYFQSTNPRSVMTKLLAVLVTMLCNTSMNAQQPIELLETTVKVNALGGEELFYYGFSEGDEIIFSMIETNGKDLKDVEIIEWPSSMKFSERKVARVEKTIRVNRTGIYKFRLHNTAFIGRNCKVTIKRIPSGDATRNFNSTVYWKTIYDTTYYTVEENYLGKTDTTATTFFSRVVKIPAPVMGNPSRQLLELPLPNNTRAWAVYLGTGEEGREAYYEGRERFLNSASCSDSSFPGYGAMAAVALDRKNVFPAVNAKQRINYWFIADRKNADLFQQGGSFSQFKEGRTAGEAIAMNKNLAGTAYIGLANPAEPETEVTVKAVAVIISEQYKTRTVQKMRINKTEEPYLKN